MANVKLTELGKRPPGSLTRPFRAFYQHIVTGKEYVQTKYPDGKRWVEIVEGGGTPHVKVLNDLDNVTVPAPNVGDTLQFDGTDWFNAPPAPPGEDTFVGQSLFVSSKGVDVTEGAERENLTVHFNNINQARDAASPMLVTGGNVIANGSGYIFPGTNVATTPVNVFSTGSGLTVDYFTIGFGIGITVNNPGTGYVNGESVTVNGGDNLMTFELIVEQVKDTIYVYGDAISNGNLAKQNTNYVFSGKGTISSSNDMFDDLGGTISEIYVRGDAFFNLLSNGREVISITGADTYYDIECYRILGRGNRVIRMHGGQPESKIKVDTTIICNLVNYTIDLDSNAKGTIEVGDHIGNTSSNGGSETIRLNHLNYDYTIIGDIKNNSTQGWSTITNYSSFVPHVGTLKIIGDVYANPLLQMQFFSGPSVMQIHCKLELIGDIYTDSRAAWSSVYFNASMEIVHTGNVYSGFGGSLFLFPGGKSPDLVMNGDIYSSASAGPVVIYTTGGKFRFNGKVHNTFLPAAPGSVAQATVTTGGTGYPGQTVLRNVATTGGTGTGLTLVITMSSTNPNVGYVQVDDPGINYTAGDVVTVSGAGNGDATVTINAIGVSGIILDDAVAYDAVFDNALIVIDAAHGDEVGIGAYAGNKNVIITNQIASNKAPVNITNLVIGSSFFDDANIQ